MSTNRSWLLGGLLCASLCLRALAQPGPSVDCSVSASPATLYASGVAELLPDILLRCVGSGPTNSVPRQDIRIALSVSLNVSVTNTAVSGNAGRTSNSVLVVNDNTCPTPSASGSTFGSCGAPERWVQDPQYGRVADARTLAWTEVSLPFPGALRPDGSGRTNPPVSTMRVTGVRGNVSQVRMISATNPAGPPVSASVNVRADPAVVVRNATVELGYPVLGVGLELAEERPAPACQGNDRGTATLRLREGFAHAFRSQPSATRILLDFTDMPEGLSVRLPAAVHCSQPRFDAGGAGSAENLSLGLVSGHQPDGSGGSASRGYGGADSGLRVDVAGGSGRAVYEVLSDDPALAEDCHVPLRFEMESDEVAGARAVVSAGLAPRSAMSLASAVAPTPRFSSPAAGQAVRVSLASCGSALMFPFVSNQAGFTSGIVITHGSRQALVGSATEDAGACDLHYSGATAEGQEINLVQFSTPIDPGEQLVFTLSGGNPVRNILGTNQFQGYIVAICAFRNAQGYAFISDGFGAIPDLAMGYLAPAAPIAPDGKRVVVGKESR